LLFSQCDQQLRKAHRDLQLVFEGGCSICTDLNESLPMNLDELANHLRTGFSDPVVQKIGTVMLQWKTDTSTAEDLRERVERYIGNSWISREEDHQRVYGLWSSFRDEAIGGIGGMTMNERLYWFGLFDRFDGSTKEERLVVYRKLHATP
jgi:hypothetical protein